MDLVEYSVSRPAAIPVAGRMYILIVAAIRSPVAGAFVVHPGDAPSSLVAIRALYKHST